MSENKSKESEEAKEIKITGSEEDRVNETEKNDSAADPADTAKEKDSSEKEKTDSQKKDTRSESGEDAEEVHFFKKQEKEDPKDARIAELTDRVQRQMAEFDNFRKRTEKEKSQMYQIGAKDVIEKLLPIVDNFERGLATAKEEDPFVDGMKKVYKQMTTMLSDLGVKPIEAVGKEFDPNFHNAVMHVDDESQGENVVVEEFQKGYTYGDSVVRHSMVKVAN